MMMHREEEYLQLSGIQHFVFCRRQWALIHIEQQCAENERITDGDIMRRHAHDAGFLEKRGSVMITRGMQISSSQLGICGECDVVEFRRDSKGIAIQGLEGTYRVIPVEYKRGEPRKSECDIMQLCAQALCLEDMLCCEIAEGALFYGETRRRLPVAFDDGLRSRTRAVIEEMHDLYRKHDTPKARRSKACNACSLRNLCLPTIAAGRSVSAYIAEMLGESE